MSKNVIFPDTSPINPHFIKPVVNVVKSTLAGIGISPVTVGSAHEPDLDRGKDDWSNDIDVQVELADVIKALNPQVDPTDKKDTVEKAARRALEAFMQEQGFQTARAGVNVFVRVPYQDQFYQVDLETIYKVAKVSRYHQHKIPKGSPYKGVSKQLLIAILAKQKGYMYSAWEGLYRRTPDNKKGELVADDWDQIAKVLLGGHANGNNLDSVEAIMQSLPQQQASDLLALAKADKNWVERTPVRESSVNWFRNISQKLDV